MSTTNLAIVAYAAKHATGGCHRHPPALATVTQSGTPTSMERDMTAQAQWLASEAINRDYHDLDALLQQTPYLYARLASQWRRMHPLFEAA